MSSEKFFTSDQTCLFSYALAAILYWTTCFESSTFATRLSPFRTSFKPLGTFIGVECEKQASYVQEELCCCSAEAHPRRFQPALTCSRISLFPEANFNRDSRGVKLCFFFKSIFAWRQYFATGFDRGSFWSRLSSMFPRSLVPIAKAIQTALLQSPFRVSNLLRKRVGVHGLTRSSVTDASTIV